jgi:2-dehydro-3-deoxy-D-gluconate 5-dehydrogenase
MALGLSEAGANLVLVDYVSSGETASQIKARGSKAEIVIADLLQMESIPRVIDATISAFGKIDILVNNAGIILFRVESGSHPMRQARAPLPR